MESRASPTEKGGFNRPAISRRSVRSPSTILQQHCSMADSLVSVINVERESERKIDDISRDVSSIKTLLAGLELNRATSTQTSQEQPRSASLSSSPAEAINSKKSQSADRAALPPRWDYSAHIIDFVQSIIRDNGSVQGDTEWGSTVSSLKILVNALENPHMTRSQQPKPHEPPESIPTPPLEAVVQILRWVKEIIE
ncbi:hypothetical protein FNYG_15364 [Fusarium nygamai]|uniref:Uncharacterized protein n=1 Tax=Gibberella nygamai TaxID=42673 RepID=A0A2K0UEW6_GIBNY|nr:hypothetical protein FNYG_15364 [Fusarium nygamai]